MVRGFELDGGSLTSIGNIVFNAWTGVTYGVNVADGDVDDDGYSEVATATGPGPSLRPQFIGWNYDDLAISRLPGFDLTLSSPTFYGGRLGTGELTGNGDWELLAGLGRDASAPATVHPFAYDGTALSPLPTFNPFPGQGYGVNVAGGDVGH